MRHILRLVCIALLFLVAACDRPESKCDSPGALTGVEATLAATKRALEAKEADLVRLRSDRAAEREAFEDELRSVKRESYTYRQVNDFADALGDFAVSPEKLALLQGDTWQEAARDTSVFPEPEAGVLTSARVNIAWGLYPGVGKVVDLFFGHNPELVAKTYTTLASMSDLREVFYQYVLPESWVKAALEELRPILAGKVKLPYQSGKVREWRIWSAGCYHIAQREGEEGDDCRDAFTSLDLGEYDPALADGVGFFMRRWEKGKEKTGSAYVEELMKVLAAELLKSSGSLTSPAE